jgi:hypothetical protein
MPKTKNATGAAATERLVLEMQSELDHLKSQVVIGGFSVEPVPGIASVRLRKTGNHGVIAKKCHDMTAHAGCNRW